MRKVKDNILNGLVWLSAIFTIGILVIILGFIFIKGIGKINLTFLTSNYSAGARRARQGPPPARGPAQAGGGAGQTRVCARPGDARHLGRAAGGARGAPDRRPGPASRPAGAAGRTRPRGRVVCGQAAVVGLRGVACAVRPRRRPHRRAVRRGRPPRRLPAITRRRDAARRQPRRRAP